VAPEAAPLWTIDLKAPPGSCHPLCVPLRLFCMLMRFLLVDSSGTPVTPVRGPQRTFSTPKVQAAFSITEFFSFFFFFFFYGQLAPPPPLFLLAFRFRATTRREKSSGFWWVPPPSWGVCITCTFKASDFFFFVAGLLSSHLPQ